MESVILTSPFLLTLYGIALLLCLIELKSHATGYLFPILSCVIFVATTIYALLTGTPMSEIGIVTLLFLAVNLTSYKKDGGNKS